MIETSAMRIVRALAVLSFWIAMGGVFGAGLGCLITHGSLWP